MGSSIFKRRVGIDEMKRILGRNSHRDWGGRTRAFRAMEIMREKCFEEGLLKRKNYTLERPNKAKPKNYPLGLISGSLMDMVVEVHFHGRAGAVLQRNKQEVLS